MENKKDLPCARRAEGARIDEDTAGVGEDKIRFLAGATHRAVRQARGK